MRSLKYFAALCFSTIWTSVAAQPGPQSFSNRADSLMNEGNVLDAITEYQGLLSLNPEDPALVYNYASALSIDNTIIKHFDSCFKYLHLAVELDTSLAALIDPAYLPAREDKRWEIFENRLVSMLKLKNGNSYSDIEYARALWRLRALDQAYFNEIGIAMRKIGMRSSVASAVWKLKFLLQQESQRELSTLVDQKGWPRVKDVGREAAMGAYLVAIHTNDGSQKRYLPFIKEICEANELPWVRYANIYDRCLFNENKPQKYGTHTRFNEFTRSEELYPLEDESKVDEWRKEIGLEPLAEYLARMNIRYEPKNK